MSVKSKQVTKPAETMRAPGMPHGTTEMRGFAGNHTLMRKQNEVSDKSEFEPARVGWVERSETDQI